MCILILKFPKSTYLSIVLKIHELAVQLNKYETAPNFIQLSQNLTSDCLLISVFLPVFTRFCIM